MSTPTHLLLLCCHATYRGDGSNPYDEATWILQDFQKSNPSTGKPGEHLTFLQHIQAAAAILAQDPSALLIFSGGKTQSQVDLSEAESYRRVYDVMYNNNDNNRGKDPGQQLQLKDLTCKPADLLPTRVATEPHATDSYQNLLFSLLRFHALTKTYPTRITILTHAFKAPRFLHLHGPALKYPSGNLRVLGIDPPFTREELRDVEEGERVRGYEAFERDLYGVGEVLGGKRRARGWVGGAGFDGVGAEGVVGRLLEWEGGVGGREVFGERLPWESG